MRLWWWIDQSDVEGVEFVGNSLNGRFKTSSRFGNGASDKEFRGGRIMIFELGK